MSKHIWIVDDDRSIRFVLTKALKRAGYDVSAFERASDVLEALESHRPSTLVSDIRMPGMSGTELLAKVKERWPEIPVIIMTAFSDLDSAVSAFQGGAFEYLPKPFDIAQAVELIGRAAAEGDRAEEASRESDVSVASGLIGRAPAMQEVFRAIGRLSQSNATVLLTGESGSGKEVVARAIKDHSQRAKAPYVAINMASIPGELLESELYGHEKGAFTGASALHRGRFEQAKGGTIFLDEIGDMPMALQTSLLRVLSDGYFYRVGGHEPIKADVRVIAATNQNLEARVKEGLFREDLYHRLNVIRLRLPPLRDRKEDIPPMVEHFLRVGAKELGVEPKRLTPEAMQALLTFDFPGNVRQLENFCRWLLVMAPSTEVRPEDLPEEVQAAQAVVSTHSAEGKPTESAFSHSALPEQGSWGDLLAREVQQRLLRGENDIWDRVMDTFERAVIGEALKFTDGRRVEAATRLGIGRNTLTRKVKEMVESD
ncbi:MAG: nitrogen regulation protein NR(I) [Sutterella sp.]|nr:nitrogen regulation protein NR(I) [Sutterella sp.]